MGLCFVFSFSVRLCWGNLPLSGPNQVVRSIKVIDSRFITFLNQECSHFIRGKQSPDDLEIRKKDLICVNRGKKKVNLKCQSSELRERWTGNRVKGLENQPSLKNDAVVPRTECASELPSGIIEKFSRYLGEPPNPYFDQHPRWFTPEGSSSHSTFWKDALVQSCWKSREYHCQARPGTVLLLF